MQALKGFRDFFPPEMARRTHVFEAWRRVARRFGFAEFDGPPVEYLELYTRKSGDEIVRQLYNFQDKASRHVALRPEMTPTLARMIAARAGNLPRPIKWFSIPQLFRYEEKQRGRLREHFQLNVDIIGSRAIEADAELLAVALEIQRELGLGKDDVLARVNDRRVVAGVLKALEVTEDNIPAVYTAIDKFRRVSQETFRAFLGDAGVPGNAVSELYDLCSGAVSVFDWYREHPDADSVSRKAAETLETYLSLLAEQELEELVEVDFSIVRGLAYYTGIVFELYDRKGKERAICGGGRYDDLIATMGGPAMPALGFGMGDVVLSLMLSDRGLFPEQPARVDVLVIPVGEELFEAARKVTRTLRLSDISSETPYTPAGVGKNLKAANQAGARFAVIVGPDEWKENAVMLRDLRSGEQERIAVDKLGDLLRALED